MPRRFGDPWCCFGKPLHPPMECPLNPRGDHRDLICLIACLGVEPIPGSMIFRGASPTQTSILGSDGDWIYELPEYVTKPGSLESMIALLIQTRILYSTAWAAKVDDNAPEWVSRDVAFYSDSQMVLLETLRRCPPIDTSPFSYWRELAIRLIFHSFPYPSDPLYVFPCDMPSSY